MKFLITAILSLLVFTLNSSAYASSEFKIKCDKHVAELSNIFVANQWTKTSAPWYSSWAHDTMDNYLFVGGMRTIDDKYPTDVNPHLTFLKPAVDYDDDHGEIIMCRYTINNSELEDIDNILEMRTFIYLPQNSCYVSSADTITCKD